MDFARGDRTRCCGQVVWFWFWFLGGLLGVTVGQTQTLCVCVCMCVCVKFFFVDLRQLSSGGGHLNNRTTGLSTEQLVVK